GGAVVDVGDPHVEGNRGYLEGEAHHEERGGRPEETAASAPQRSRDVHESRGCGRAVSEGSAVKEDRGGERAEHEILEGRLRRPLSAPQVGGEAVGGERHGLEGDEDDDEVGGLAEQAHPRRAEEGERVELAPRGAQRLEIAEGYQA